MISDFIIRHMVKDYKNTEDKAVRQRYGFAGGIIGICANFLLFLIKLSVGTVTKSVAVVADAINNLSDAGSSLITIIGFRIADRPADEEHPFGHGRIEYISGLIVSFLVLLVGIEFIKTSFQKILHPEKVVFKAVPFILIILSIIIKIWLSRFNGYVGKKINSTALKASSMDALSDVFISGCVALSLILSEFISFSIDGYVGVGVSLFILYTGFSLIKDTLNPLLGEAPDPDLVRNIKKEALKYEYIMGVHDLIIHNYGPGRSMASFHAEVPEDASFVKVHEVIDRAEKELSDNLNTYVVIHMDPINTNSKEVADLKKEVNEILKQFPAVESMHDFRVVGEGDTKNLIFDVVVDTEKKTAADMEDKLRNSIDCEIKKVHKNYNTVITVDKDFTSFK